VPGGELAVEVLGQGEPVVVVQTALTADELRPLARQLARHGGTRSSTTTAAGTRTAVPRAGSCVSDEAADCAALLDALDPAPARVVGASFSAAIALTVASNHPERVRALAIIEPPPAGTPSAREVRAANARLLERVARDGAAAALDELMTMLAGPDWRRESERELPGSVATMQRDADTFFAVDLPALLRWRLDAADVARIRCPVLLVGGTDSGPWFAEMRTWLRRLLPGAEDVVVPGAGQDVALTHASEVAAVCSDFWRRHSRRA
jgi:pimeloyl-ACP methyl ester carboxylesterase